MIESEQYNYVKPSHYELWEGCEVFDVLKKVLTKEEFIGFCKGNILKYQLRLGKKPKEPVERDKRKIEVYEKELKKIKLYEYSITKKESKSNK